jgi:PAS domain S-box-containing protein
MDCSGLTGQTNGADYAPGRIVTIYATVAALWILFSDAALGFFVSDPGLIAKISIFKGWIFVAVTSAMLYFLIKRQLGLLGRSRNAAEQSHYRFQALFEQAGDGIFLADSSNNHILEANASCLELLGYDIDELRALTIKDCLAEEEWERLTAVVEKARVGEVNREEWNLRRKDGTTAVAEVTGRMLHDGTLLGIMRDITGRKQAEGALRRSVREKEVMLREIHHRVKNNMQVIVSLLSLQAGEITDERGLAAFKETASRIRSMALIHEKLYSGADFAEVDMEGYCRSLMLTVLAATKPPDLTIEHCLDIRMTGLSIDRAIPCGLLLNELISNAIKHAFVGRASGRVTVAFYGEAGNAFLVVEDDGVGFSLDQARSASTLGYTLIGAWCEQLRAALSVEGGTSGRGSRVIVRFPLK